MGKGGGGGGDELRDGVIGDFNGEVDGKDDYDARREEGVGGALFIRMYVSVWCGYGWGIDNKI